MPSKKQKNQEYTAKQIQSLTPREHIRRRPGMYIGGIDKQALHHLIYEVLDSSIEEAMAGLCDEIKIVLQANRTVMIIDNSEGFPVTPVSPDNTTTWVEEIMTNTPFKPIFNGQHYVARGGLMGVGIRAVNALSKHCIVEVQRDGYLWQQSYEKGLTTSILGQIRPLADDESTGTRITFLPDFTILEDNDFNFETITTRCRDLAYLSSKLSITVRDERVMEREEKYHFPNGLADWVTEQSQEHKTLHDVISVQHIHQCTDKRGGHYDIKVNLAFQCLDADKMIERGFVNMIETPEGGTHLEGLHKSIMRRFWQDDSEFDWQIARRGFIGIVSIFHPDPQFERATKVKLLNPEVAEAVAEAVKIAFAQNPEALAVIREHISST